MMTVKIEGLDELLKTMRAFPVDFERREAQRAADKGIAPIEMTARMNARTVGEGMKTHASTGLLARSVVRVRGNQRSGNRAAFVAIKRLTKRQIRAFKAATGLKARQNRYDPFYWKFWEFGTSKLPAKRFIRNAWDLRRQDALDAAVSELKLGIRRSAARLARSARTRGIYG